MSKTSFRSGRKGITSEGGNECNQLPGGFLQTERHRNNGAIGTGWQHQPARKLAVRVTTSPLDERVI